MDDTTGLPDDSLEQRVIGEPAPTDKLARAVARSKITAALFAKPSAVKLGRYQLLEQVGSGGMGVVWGAWDPELERRVAIKVVKPELASARDRIVREGQSLAKLSHPHVVPIYDVGVVDDQIYLVMEWVRGETLRAWTSRSRTPREIVRAYREAAMGLAAAHEVGLVHRDFKPENAMLGADHRVRVLDFGLAHEGGAAAAGIAGTPRYMAPEQATGAGEVTPAVDQFALGVALREALGEAPPKWLAGITARLTAPAPADRYPSMQAVVDALARDPARVLRRRLALAGALALAAIAFGVGIRAGTDVEERCGGGRAEIAAEWSPAAHTKVAAHLRELGPYGASLVDRASADLDDYAKRWATTHAAACRAHDRGELTPALYTANLDCLARSRVALATARDVLATTTRDHLPEAIVAVQSLPATDRCRLETNPPPAAIASQVASISQQVARARVLALAVDPKAIDAAASAAKAADELGYAPLIGKASLVHGLAALLQQHRPDAAAAFSHATAAALEANDNATAIEALARHLYAIAITNKPLATTQETLASLTTLTPIVRGLGAANAFERSLFYNNLGTLRINQDRPAARRLFEEAERARPPRSKDTFELASIAGNLGLVESDRTKRDTLFSSEGDELEAVLGADHPLTLDARLKAAMFVENPITSATLLRDVCGRYRRMHPHLVEKITQCAYEVVWLAEERGDTAEVAAWLDAVAKPKTPEFLIAAGYRDLLANKPAEAARTMSSVADTLASQNTWSQWRIVDAELVASIAADRMGDRVGAIAAAERALARIDGLPELAASTFGQRRRGRVLAMLAVAGAGDVAARREAALEWARAAGYEARITALAAGSDSSRTAP